MICENGDFVETPFPPNPISKEMSYKTFCRFRDYVTTNLGIKMPDVKKTMLQSRLQKRLRALSIASYDDYYDYDDVVNTCLGDCSCEDNTCTQYIPS